MFQILAGLLAFFYGIIPNYAVAIGLLTLTVMLVVSPLTLKSTRSMLAMQRLQPELKRLQQEHKGDRQKLNEAMMALYKEHKVNPVAGCLPMLLQAPVFLVIYRVIRGLTKVGPEGGFEPDYLDAGTRLYRDLRDSGGKMNAFGVDLARSAWDGHSSFFGALPFFVIVAVVIFLQYYQTRQTMARNKNAAANPQQQVLLKVLPVVFGVISLSIQAALNVYFMVSALFRITQTAAMYRFDPALSAHVKKHLAETAAADAPTAERKPTPQERAADKPRAKPRPNPAALKPTSRTANGRPKARPPSGNGGRAQPNKRKSRKGR
ncbi:MAG: YidC/Oxa1 family membrane protein insertase [Acidimicrobiales bacterium]